MTTSHLDSAKCRLKEQNIFTVNKAFLLTESSVSRKLNNINKNGQKSSTLRPSLSYNPECIDRIPQKRLLFHTSQGAI